MGLYLLLQLSWLVTTVEALASQPLPTTKPGCPDKCGNVSIPYPFGIEDGCYFSADFNLSCESTSDHPPTPFLGEIEVLDISSLSGIMRISQYVSYSCYDKSGEEQSNYTNWVNLDQSPPFAFSETRNKFTIIGCDTYAFITGRWGRNFTSGCMSLCSNTDSVINGSCSGIGCCQTDIPMGFKSFELDVESFSNHKDVWNFNPCSYAFLVDQNAFSFKASDLEGINFGERSKSVPVVVDWAIKNESCEIAQKDSATFACVSEHSHCYNTANGLGYRCNCSKGYQGNPYFSGGCQDINECEEDHKKPLCQHDCINLPGNYSCSCRKGYHGLRYDQRECIKDKHVVFFILLGQPSIPINILVQELNGRLETWLSQLGFELILVNTLK